MESEQLEFTLATNTTRPCLHTEHLSFEQHNANYGDNGAHVPPSLEVISTEALKITPNQLQDGLLELPTNDPLKDRLALPRLCCRS